MTPVDINMYKTANLPESYINRLGNKVTYSKEQQEDSRITVKETLVNNGLDINVLKDVIEIPIYATNEITIEKFFGSEIGNVKRLYAMMDYSTQEEIIKISDYNRIARLYGTEQYELNEDEYIVICNFDNMASLRSQVLSIGGNKLTIAGKQYKSKYNECKNGFIAISTNHTNTGIILVPDSCALTEESKAKSFLVAN